MFCKTYYSEQFLGSASDVVDRTTIGFLAADKMECSVPYLQTLPWCKILFVGQETLYLHVGALAKFET